MSKITFYGSNKLEVGGMRFESVVKDFELETYEKKNHFFALYSKIWPYFWARNEFWVKKWDQNLEKICLEP